VSIRRALEHLGIGTTMIVAAVITLVGAVVSLAWAPETRGMTLGESSALGGDTAPSAVAEHRFRRSHNRDVRRSGKMRRT
jgi:hypothetical protein